MADEKPGKRKGRPPGALNRATLEIKEFARKYLESDRYRRNLKSRIESGEAPHMETLLHYYAFGKPRTVVEITPPSMPLAQVLAAMTVEEARMIFEVSKRLDRGTVIDVEARALPPARIQKTRRGSREKKAPKEANT